MIADITGDILSIPSQFGVTDNSRKPIVQFVDRPGKNLAFTTVNIGYGSTATETVDSGPYRIKTNGKRQETFPLSGLAVIDFVHKKNQHAPCATPPGNRANSHERRQTFLSEETMKQFPVVTFVRLNSAADLFSSPVEHRRRHLPRLSDVTLSR